MVVERGSIRYVVVVVVVAVVVAVVAIAFMVRSLALSYQRNKHGCLGDRYEVVSEPH
jgi:hypothetical protein